MPSSGPPRAGETREIISRPVLLASNNTEATFLVGSQRPFVQVSRSLPDRRAEPGPGGAVPGCGDQAHGAARRSIRTGTSLSAIQQEINSATSEVQFDAPVISTREARTQVLVRDGQTIVIGGLRDDQRDRTQSGVPILSGIPIIGGLFGSASRRHSETELFIFITPRIIRTDEDADQITDEHLPAAAGLMAGDKR